MVSVVGFSRDILKEIEELGFSCSSRFLHSDLSRVSFCRFIVRSLSTLAASRVKSTHKPRLFGGFDGVVTEPKELRSVRPLMWKVL
ncbi:unnamed protein product [Lactuca virosa]|uniref:Uncharacterized protein n=1 Tax=Lactuca virosa TaxID=75947 RepID=A0AAU9N1J9_9ASTR|nr:unnamed protein product [Lactuca virosa]